MLLVGRQIGIGGQPLFRADCEAARRAGFDLFSADRERDDAGGKMPTEYIGGDLPGTAIAHMIHLDAGFALKQLIEQLRLRSDRDRRIADRTRMCLGVGDELAKRFVR